MIFKKLILAAGVMGTLGAAAPAFADHCAPVAAPIAVSAPMPAPVEVAWGYGRGYGRGGEGYGRGGYGYGRGYGYGYGYYGGGFRGHEGRRWWHPIYRGGFHRGRW